MNNEFASYQSLAMRTAKPMGVQDDLLHAALGLGSEAGEFSDCIKKHWAYSQPLDRYNAVEELGDLMWYVALACNALGVGMGDVAAQNINKLRTRYPKSYQDELAAFRADKQQEIAA
jgi:NTP pyrophosphatase (non-canonical NTP hydrolase)